MAMGRKYATLADLPVELIMQVLSEDEEFRTKRVLYSLRLVCPAMNEAVRHRALERMRIRSDLAKIGGMVSAPNTFDTCCRELHLEGHNHSAMNPLWRVLGDLVGKMNAVREVHWTVQCHLHAQVFTSIFQLPLLETLELDFLQRPPSFSRPRLQLPAFSKLRNLTVNLSYLRNAGMGLRLDSCDVAMSIISYVLSNTPALEHLAIWPSSILSFHLVHLGDNFTRLWNHISEPTLRTLTAQSITIPTSPAWIGFLTSLTTLEIPNNREKDHLLWPALHSSQIHLTAIKVERLSSPLTDYLKGYRGLRLFKVGSRVPAGPRIGGLDMLSICLRYALPHHHKTLEDLRFCPAYKADGGLVFSVLSSVLHHRFLPTTCIKRLDLPYFVPVDTGQGLVSIFALIATHFASLETIHLHLISEKKTEGTPPKSLGTYTPLDYFLSLKGRVHLVHQPPAPNGQSQRIIVSADPQYRAFMQGIPCLVNRVVYRAVFGEKQLRWYALRLEVDEVATELLNEGWDHQRKPEPFIWGIFSRTGIRDPSVKYMAV